MSNFDLKKALLECGEGVWAYIMIIVIIGLTMNKFKRVK